MSDGPDELLVDLAAARTGGVVLAANDEFFAPKENLIKDEAPVWDPDRYTDRGKWMDGWETRRRREPGHDWAVIRLGLPGIVRRVVIDTAHFTGNYPESAAVEGIWVPGEPELVEVVRDPSRWDVLVPRSNLAGDTMNEIEPSEGRPATHVRLVVHPDGGVARLRVLGDPLPPPDLVGDHESDLAALTNGARAVDCSDKHYSSPNRMLVPGRPRGMWDGWETRRRRGPGNDWALIRLGGRGTISRIQLDTTHFKGNAPGSVAVFGTDDPEGEWSQVLAETPVSPDRVHDLENLEESGPVSYVRLDIHPDGGVARFRCWGRAEAPWNSKG